MFIIGVMVGLIIAGGFFILKLDDYFKELNFYKNVAKTFYLHSKSTESVIRTEDVKYVDEIKSNKISTKRRSNFIVDSSNVRNSEIAAISDSDSLNHHLEKDTLLLYNNVSEEIVVRKDELLSNKTLEVINLNPLVSLANYSDSVLQKVSGVRDDRNNTKQYFNIELWQSPLNYRGYKMSKYKIVLYGNIIFLKYNGDDRATSSLVDFGNIVRINNLSNHKVA